MMEGKVEERVRIKTSEKLKKKWSQGAIQSKTQTLVCQFVSFVFDTFAVSLFLCQEG